MTFPDQRALNQQAAHEFLRPLSLPDVLAVIEAHIEARPVEPHDAPALERLGNLLGRKAWRADTELSHRHGTDPIGTMKELQRAKEMK